MKRRTFLASSGGALVASAAGCIDIESTEDGGTTDRADDELVVATYGSFIDSPSTSPGAWLKEEFESEFDARLVWQTPPQEINYFIQRQQEGVAIEADLYLGLTTSQLVRVDENLDDPLFQTAPDVEGMDDIRPGLDFDPDDRALAFNTGYISLVYDSTEIQAPTTFDGLLDEEFAGDLIVQNPGTSSTGRAFLLHTIDHYGEDGYLEFWRNLQDNGVQILGSWDDAYGAWQEGAAPMVVSYSTDQVFASQEGADLDEHQIRFLEDQAYANPEGMALFEDAYAPDLAEEFMAFLLRPEIQGEIAQRNVVFPATENAELPAEYDVLAHEPPEAVTFGYDRLQGSVEGWIDDWEREIVQG